MKLKFVPDTEVQARDGRRNHLNKFTEFIEELYKHPNQWAEYPELINNSTTMYRMKERFDNIEVALRGGNNLAVNHPDKKSWTVYIRYVPDSEATIDEEELI